MPVVSRAQMAAPKADAAARLLGGGISAGREPDRMERHDHDSDDEAVTTSSRPRGAGGRGVIKATQQDVAVLVAYWAVPSVSTPAMRAVIDRRFTRPGTTRGASRHIADRHACDR